jgi:hypothetical protein
MPVVLLLVAPFCVAVARGNEPDKLATYYGGVFMGRSPVPVMVDAKDAWPRALAAARMVPGAFVMLGTGDSMLPLYGDGTVLVVSLQPYGLLKSGMTAIYRTRSHRLVAHLLVAKTRDGWRTTGLHNQQHDDEPVLDANFVGVVIAAFTPLPPRFASN